MGKPKTITSPDPPAGILQQVAPAEEFIGKSMLDAVEVMYRSGFARETLLWAGERCSIAGDKIKALCDAVDAEARPVSNVAERRPRNQ